MQTSVTSGAVELSPGNEDSLWVNYYAAGEGPPLVLLHGIGLDSASVSWRYALPELAATRRVYAPDLPGHGDSEKPRRRYTTEFYVDVVEQFVERLGLDEPGLVGLSMGGGVALGYALENPVDRLVLVDSYGLGTDAYWRPSAALALRTPFFDRARWGSLGLNRWTVEGNLRLLTANPDEQFVADVHEAVQDPATGRALSSWQRSEFRACGFRTCYLDDLDRIDVPTLLVHGADDPLFPASWSERAHGLLPDSRLALFEDCGHWPPRERPDRFNSAVAGFLAPATATGASD